MGRITLRLGQWKLLVFTALATEANRGKRCVVCVWGDVNFSARELVERVQRRFAHVELLPGISSIQVACARLGLTVEESLFITLHARSGYESALQEAVEAVRAGKRHVFILPRPWDMMPPAVARELMRQGVPSGVGVYVLERLTLSDQMLVPERHLSVSCDCDNTPGSSEGSWCKVPISLSLRSVGWEGQQGPLLHECEPSLSVSGCKLSPHFRSPFPVERKWGRFASPGSCAQVMMIVLPRMRDKRQ